MATNDPLLILNPPSRRDAVKPGRQGFVPVAKAIRPARQKQQRRLGSRLEKLAASIKSASSELGGVDPLNVLVFETVEAEDAATEFAKAVAKVEGLEWLAEFVAVEHFAANEDFAFEKAEPRDPRDAYEQDRKFEKYVDEGKTPFTLRFFVVLSNQQAIDELLSLWKEWQRTDRARVGYAGIVNVFRWLNDIRRWDWRDRTYSDIWKQVLREDAETDPDGVVRFETELWFLPTPERRKNARRQVAKLIRDAGGQVLSRKTIRPIQYMALLAEVPAKFALEMVEKIQDGGVDDLKLILCDKVMAFSPCAQSASPVSTGEPHEQVNHALSQPKPVNDEPLVAVLDGVPIANHRVLEGRVVVEDPDDFQSAVAVKDRDHATGVLSLVIHGDLNAGESAASRPVVSVPVMTVETDFKGNVWTVIPPDRLVVDLVWSAVRHLVVNKKSGPAAAPSVRIINLSIGDPRRLFLREISPLARLIDYLSEKYNLLFVVSAGNHGQPIQLKLSLAEWEALAIDERRREVFRAIVDDQENRLLMSPAETLNGVTVGAVDSDLSAELSYDRRHRLIDLDTLPSPLATVGAGIQKTVKPDILLPGGRASYNRDVTANPIKFTYLGGGRPPGLLAAAPPNDGTSIDHVSHVQGTSFAAALGSRIAALGLDAAIAALGSDAATAAGYEAVIAKALLVHGAGWGGARAFVKETFGVESHSEVSMCARLLGLGAVRPEIGTGGGSLHATAIGFGSISEKEELDYELPLPKCFLPEDHSRRVIATLAWITPCNLRHRNYRMSRLRLEVDASETGTKTPEAWDYQTKRGTICHRVFTQGEKSVTMTNRSRLRATVKMKRDASGLGINDRVKFAIALTFELGEPLQAVASVYESVRDRIEDRVNVRQPEPVPV